MAEEKSQSTANPQVYVGRFVGLLRTPEGATGVLYRVSSRSFPNRRAEKVPGGARIIPLEPEEEQKNPYISYCCLRCDDRWAVASNGSHTDALFERISAGLPPREALALALLAFDYEHDQLKTPRIAAAVSRGSDRGYLGIIRFSGLQVEEMELPRGRALIVATYTLDRIGTEETELPCRRSEPGAIAEQLLAGEPFSRFSHPVCSVCAVECREGFEVAVAQAAGS